MARAKIVHSEDGVLIKFHGNRKNPEPGTAVIEFPGGHVEVSRTTDGQYWAHVEVTNPQNIKRSRIDYSHKGFQETAGAIPEIPYAEEIRHMAILIGAVQEEAA